MYLGRLEPGGLYILFQGLSNEVSTMGYGCVVAEIQGGVIRGLLEKMYWGPVTLIILSIAVPVHSRNWILVQSTLLLKAYPTRYDTLGLDVEVIEFEEAKIDFSSISVSRKKF